MNATLKKYHQRNEKNLQSTLAFQAHCPNYIFKFWFTFKISEKICAFVMILKIYDKGHCFLL